MDQEAASRLGDALETVAKHLHSGSKKMGDVLVAAINLFRVAYPDYPEVINVAVRFFQTLEEEGVELRHFQNVITDEEMRNNLIKYIQIGCPRIHHQNLHATSATYEMASVMLKFGEFISPEEIANAGEMTYSKEQLRHFQMSFPTVDILQWCADKECMLVAGPPKPMSLFDIYQFNPEFFLDQRKEADIPEFFGEEGVTSEWLMIRSTGISKNQWSSGFSEDDLACADKIPETDRLPTAAEVAWIQYVSKVVMKSDWILKNEWGQRTWTSTTNKGGRHIVVGWPDWDRDKLKGRDNDKPIFVGFEPRDSMLHYRTGLITVRNLPKQ